MAFWPDIRGNTDRSVKFIDDATGARMIGIDRQDQMSEHCVVFIIRPGPAPALRRPSELSLIDHDIVGSVAHRAFNGAVGWIGPLLAQKLHDRLAQELVGVSDAVIHCHGHGERDRDVDRT